MYIPVVPTVAHQVDNPASIHEEVSSIPGRTQGGKGSGVAVSCGVGRRHSSHPLSCLL